MLHKRFSYSAVVGSVIGVVLSTSSGAVMADQLATIKEKGVLTCGTIGTVPPFSYQDQKTRQTIGYDVEVCKIIAKHLDVKLDIKLLAVPARIPELVQGRVDVVAASLGWTPERSKQIAYSFSYYLTATGLAVTTAGGLSNWDALKDKRIGSINATTSAASVKDKIPEANLVTFEDASQVYLAMRNKRIDAIALNENNLQHYKKTVDGTADAVTLLMDPPLYSEYYGVGVKLGEEALLNAVNEALLAADQDGSLNAVYEQYVGQESEYKLPRRFKVEKIEG